jgi:diaminopimelate decarboxylase
MMMHATLEKNTVTPFENTLIVPAGYTVENGQPVVGGVPVTDLIATYGTPLYVLDGQTIREAARAYKQTLETEYKAKTLVVYACKANLNVGLCKLMAQEGIGLDVVSAGELYTAMQANFPANNIVFNGNNKSVTELEMALDYGVERIIVDNFDEIGRLAAVAKRLGKVANILLRVAPGIECHTHEYIKTGQNDSKFGFPLHQVKKAIAEIVNLHGETLCLKGIHGHIGSQIFELKAYEGLVDIFLTLANEVRSEFGVTFEDLDLGGGLGIAYTPDDDPQPIEVLMKQLANTVQSKAEALNYPLPRIFVEPGRSLIARAGITLYTVGGRKVVEGVTPFISVDGGMGDNIRPALYQAVYSAVVANKLTQANTETVRVVGKYCESGDVLLRAFDCPTLEPSDTLLVFGTGAYNHAMSSNYNRIGRPAMVLVENGNHGLLVERESLAYLAANDRIPAWFE